jgi:hypothetical protein
MFKVPSKYHACSISFSGQTEKDTDYLPSVGSHMRKIMVISTLALIVDKKIIIFIIK